MADSILKYALIAGGGYIALRFMGIDLLSMFHTVQPPAPPTTPQANNPNSAAANNTKAQVAAAIGSAANQYQTVDTWNYYYQQVRNLAGPSPETLFPGADRNKKYSIDEWWAAMTGSGFSGLGAIAHWVNPYGNFQGTPFGGNLIPRGAEKFIWGKN